MSGLKFILLVLLLLTLKPAVHGCTCLLSESATEGLKQADAVFAGKVTKIRKHKPPKGEPASHAYDMIDVEAVFEATTAWKGIKEKKISVFTASQSATCGYSFREDESYLVYANRDQAGRLITSICSRTQKLKAAQDDLKELGTGTALTTQP